MRCKQGISPGGYFSFTIFFWYWFYIYLCFYRAKDKNNSANADKFSCWLNEWSRKAGSIKEGKIQYGNMCIQEQRMRAILTVWKTEFEVPQAGLRQRRHNSVFSPLLSAWTSEYFPRHLDASGMRAVHRNTPGP